MYYDFKLLEGKLELAVIENQDFFTSQDAILDSFYIF